MSQSDLRGLLLSQGKQDDLKCWQGVRIFCLFSDEIVADADVCPEINEVVPQQEALQLLTTVRLPL